MDCGIVHDIDREEGHFFVVVEPALELGRFQHEGVAGRHAMADAALFACICRARETVLVNPSR